MRKIEMEKQFITFQFTLIGQHHYPGHPTLSTPHVHYFDMAVLLETFEDRGIEFIEFRDRIKAAISDNSKIASTYTNRNGITTSALEFGAMSCEMLCKEVARVVANNLPPDYPTADLQVVVCESEEYAAGVWRGKILAA